MSLHSKEKTGLHSTLSTNAVQAACCTLLKEQTCAMKQALLGARLLGANVMPSKQALQLTR